MSQTARTEIHTGFRWESILYLGSRRQCQKGEIIFTQDDPFDKVWYLQEGRVKVSVLRADGSEKTLLIMGPGSTIGEAAAFDCDPFRVTATALTKCTVYSFNCRELINMMRTRPDMALHFIQSLSKKIRFLAFQIEDLVFLDVAGRLAHVLLMLAADHGKVHDDKRIELRMTHQELANFAGSNRVTVTNALKFLASHGIIEAGRERILILDTERLRLLAR